MKSHSTFHNVTDLGIKIDSFRSAGDLGRYTLSLQSFAATGFWYFRQLKMFDFKLVFFCLNSPFLVLSFLYMTGFSSWKLNDTAGPFLGEIWGNSSHEWPGWSPGNHPRVFSSSTASRCNKDQGSRAFFWTNIDVFGCGMEGFMNSFKLCVSKAFIHHTGWISLATRCFVDIENNSWLGDPAFFLNEACCKGNYHFQDKVKPNLAVHPGKLTWNPNMEVWKKMDFPFPTGDFQDQNLFIFKAVWVDSFRKTNCDP